MEPIASSDCVIYALKGAPDDCNYWDSLKQGEGRFGWSYERTADLRSLKSRIDAAGLSSLTAAEIDCYQSFLLDLKAGDWVVYVNAPEWGKCILARVNGPYHWRFDDTDFNHRFPVEPKSVFVFDRNDAVVHPALSACLKLRGRYWRIYLKKDFQDLVQSLEDSGATGAPRTPATNIRFLAREIQPLLTQITEKIHHTHPNYDLEHLIAHTLRNIPGVKEVKQQGRSGGAGDHGADILVVFEAGLPIPGLLEQRVCIVQVKSFEDQHWDTQAVEDIRRGFNHYPEAAVGLIVSTATSSTKTLDDAIEKLRNETGKPVSLLIGAEVAALLLRYSDQLLVS